MSKWTDFRDGIENAVDFSDIGEDVKENFTAAALNELLPAAEVMAEKFIAAIKEQSANETGWCKIRDAIVLPAVINLGLYAMRKLLTATVNGTVKV